MSTRAVVVFLMLTVALCGSANHKAETSKNNCMQCCFKEHDIDSKDILKGKPLVLQSNYTRLGTEDQQVPANYLWRIVCPVQNMKIVTILMKLNLSRGDYLQIKRKQLEGCEHMDTFRPFFFNKKSIRVSLFSNSTQGSAFELGYVCVESNVWDWSRGLFTNENVLKYMKDHPGVFEKIGHLIIDPSYILDADPDILEIFKLPTTTVTACCAPSDELDYSSSGEIANSA